MMTRALTTGSQAYNQQVKAFASMFKAGNGTAAPGAGPTAGAMHMGQAYIYNQLHRQAAVLAYVDIIRDLSIFCACMIPILFFIPRPPKHASMSAGH
jgi:DHA2 family multidrug resistance protein